MKGISMSKKPVIKPPTILTFTLPDSGDEDSRTGTLLVQRGDLARVHQFSYQHIADLTQVIDDALVAFADVEADPPIIPETPPTKPQPKTSSTSVETPAEPTVDIPLRKGKKTVKISFLKITGGETDAAAYRQAVLIAGRLIDGKLWDGETPIRFDDVHRVAKKITPLLDKELSLFSLEDFVQVGEVQPQPVVTETTDKLQTLNYDEDDEPFTHMPPHDIAHFANGVSAQTSLI
jgi:hypothetical protein